LSFLLNGRLRISCTSGQYRVAACGKVRQHHGKWNIDHIATCMHGYERSMHFRRGMACSHVNASCFMAHVKIIQRVFMMVKLDLTCATVSVMIRHPPKWNFQSPPHIR
jgi:hypothetical protein